MSDCIANRRAQDATWIASLQFVDALVADMLARGWAHPVKYSVLGHDEVPHPRLLQPRTLSFQCQRTRSSRSSMSVQIVENQAALQIYLTHATTGQTLLISAPASDKVAVLQKFVG